MKKKLLLILVALFSLNAMAQTGYKQPVFTADEQKSILTLLSGSGLSAKFNSAGGMVIATPTELADVTPLSGGGFKAPSSVAACGALVYTNWVLAGSNDKVVSKLGSTKAASLSKIITPKIAKQPIISSLNQKVILDQLATVGLSARFNPDGGIAIGKAADLKTLTPVAGGGFKQGSVALCGALVYCNWVLAGSDDNLRSSLTTEKFTQLSNSITFK